MTGGEVFMANHTDLGEAVKKALGDAFLFEKIDIGSDAKLSAKGTTLETERYEIKGFGHLCILHMRAMMGMMKMETAVLASFEKELPLMNLDWVQAMGKETQIIEYYDDRAADFDQTLLQSFKENGKGKTDAFNQKVAEALDAFADRMKTAKTVDPKEKADCIKRYAEGLLEADGPAVRQMKKLFGEETARRLVCKHMYGID